MKEVAIATGPEWSEVKKLIETGTHRFLLSRCTKYADHCPYVAGTDCTVCRQREYILEKIK